MLGVSDATLRRMARAYERVHGRLPTDARQARVYTDDVVKALEAARDLVEDGRVASFDKALEVMAAGDPGELLAPQAPPQALEALRAELAALIRQEVAAALEAHHGERMRELERRNAYLEGELKRRDEQGKSEQSRIRWPWWKVWGE